MVSPEFRGEKEVKEYGKKQSKILAGNCPLSRLAPLCTYFTDRGLRYYLRILNKLTRLYSFNKITKIMGIERTIQSLSNKIWYRFIKVLYILCFLFISSIALFISYDAYKPKKIFDNEKSYIQCTATEGILYILALNGVYLWSDYISSDNDKMFSQWCLNAIQEEAKPKTRQQDTPMITEIENFKKKYPQFADIDDATIADWLATKYPNAYGDLPAKVKRQAPSPEMKKEPIGETKGSRWQDAPIIPDTSYKLVSHYKTEGTWNNFVIASIVSITTIFLIFETGRRIFYYVILGSLFPRKKA